MFIVPDQCKNELEGLEHLTKCLNRRFSAYPAVYMGTLKDAVKEAFNQKEILEVGHLFDRFGEISLEKLSDDHFYSM